MKISLNVKKTATIAFILMITFSTLMTALPVVNAAVTDQTRIFVSLFPNPVGVGQEITIGVWIYPIPLNANMRYDNISVTMTKPDGTKQVFGPAIGGPLGNWVWLYTPSAAGNYTFVASWPGRTYYNVSYAGSIQDVTRSGDTSPSLSLVVQEEPVERMDDTPLPTEYWTYPINAQNYLWAGGMGQADYCSGPMTAHVMWTMPNAFGGIEGAPYDAVSYASGTMYESKRTPNIIINGRYYQYGSVQGGAGDRIVAAERLLYCYDLATGKTLWSKNITVSFAQIYEYNSANQVGLHAYLWSTSGSTNQTWSMYDAYDGDWIMDFVNGTSGNRFTEDQMVAGPVPYHASGCYRGNMLQYIVNNRQGWLALWNFTKMVDSSTTNNGVITYQSQAEKDQFGVYGGQWRPGSSVSKKNWLSGIEWNVSFTPDAASTGIPAFTSFTGISYKNQMGIYSAQEGNNKRVYWGYSINPSNPGRKWGPVNQTITIAGGLAVGEDLFVVGDPATMCYYGWDVNTGALKWQSDPATFPWGSLTDIGQRISFDQTQLYVASYDGLHIYDMTNGKEQNFFTAGNSGVETPYGTWVGRFNSLIPDGDGKLYFSTGAWHPQPAYERGDRMFCVDVETGKNIWNFSGYWMHRDTPSGVIGPLANGYLLSLNEYDQTVYCFAKGPTATTVTAPQTAVPSGTSLLIQGTVVDTSPGKANGYAAVSDEWMTPWMEYIFQQQPKPANAMGVPVSIDAYDPNGNLVHIGDATSDTTGLYTLAVDSSALAAGPGQYRIIATFKGSNGYYKSSAETGLLISAASAATPGPTTAAASSDVMNAITTSAIAIGIVIVIAIAIATLLILRKKP